jgi:hypothetical protein
MGGDFPPIIRSPWGERRVETVGYIIVSTHFISIVITHCQAVTELSFISIALLKLSNPVESEKPEVSNSRSGGSPGPRRKLMASERSGIHDLPYGLLVGKDSDGPV